VRFDALDQWLAWMERLHPSEIDLGLERVRQVAKAMDLPAFSGNLVVVAGTNGKGSCVHALQELLRASGSTVATYTSPHIERYNERVCFDGSAASDAELCDAFARVDSARGSTSLTYFEFGTLAALYLIQRRNPDYAILEVGLGGRLDAVNIVDADLAIITSIDIDHESWLGNTRELIAHEKGGILRAGIDFVCADEDPPVNLDQLAHSLGVNARWINRDFSCDRSVVCCEGKKIAFGACTLPRNAVAAALQGYYLLCDKPLPEAALAEVLDGLTLPGRMERTTIMGVEWIFDVAHNPAAARNLAAELRHAGDKGLTAIFTLMADKDSVGVIEAMVSVVSHWVCTQIDGMTRCAGAESLRETLVHKFGIPENAAESEELGRAVASALDRVRTCKQPKVLVFGSFYLVAAIKSLLVAQEFKREQVS